MPKKENRPVEEVWLSLEQTADALGESRETLRRWARDGDARVPAYRVWDEADGGRGRFRFKQSEVEAFKARKDAGELIPDPPAAAPARRSSRTT